MSSFGLALPPAEPYQAQPYQAEPRQAEPYQAKPHRAEPHQAAGAADDPDDAERHAPDRRGSDRPPDGTGTHR
jgi:hypothetical protein